MLKKPVTNPSGQGLVQPSQLFSHQRKLLPAGSSVMLAGPTRAELARIHIAKRDLKLTDELYRGFLHVLFGRSSAKDLTHEQVEELLVHFRSLGWGSEYITGASGSRRASPSHGIEAQIRLIKYLWMHGPGIRKKTPEALEHFLSHHFHVSGLKQIKARQIPGILGAIRNMGKM